MSAIKEHSIIHTVLKMVTCQDVGTNRFFRNWIWQHCWMSFLIPGHGSETGCMPFRISIWGFEDLFLDFLSGSTIYTEIRRLFPLSWATLGLRSVDAEVGLGSLSPSGWPCGRGPGQGIISMSSVSKWKFEMYHAFLFDLVCMFGISALLSRGVGFSA